MMLCETGKRSDVEKYHLKRAGERKIDGCRVMAICDEQVTLIGRSGSNYTNKFPEIVESLKGFKGILDGEIFCGTFDKTASRVHTENSLKSRLLVKEYPAIYYVFDILSLDGVDLRDEIYLKRAKILLEMPIWNTFIQKVEKSMDLINMWQKCLLNKWEGIIIKDLTAKYTGKRSWAWIKVKNIKSKDLTAISYEVNTAGIRVETKEGIALQISGLNALPVKKLIDETGSANIECNYLNETASGMLRMPTFKCLK